MRGAAQSASRSKREREEIKLVLQLTIAVYKRTNRVFDGELARAGRRLVVEGCGTRAHDSSAYPWHGQKEKKICNAQ